MMFQQYYWLPVINLLLGACPIHTALKETYCHVDTVLLSRTETYAYNLRIEFCHAILRVIKL